MRSSLLIVFSVGLATCTGQCRVTDGPEWALAGSTGSALSAHGMALQGIDPMTADRPLATSPFAQFHDWMAEAEKWEPNDPNAMVVATATPNGHPSVRTILLKGVDDRGFVFYTNKESRKGGELAVNPRGGVAVLLEVAEAANPDRGHGRACHGCGGRRLLRISPAELTAWRLGVAAVASVGRIGQFWRSGWRRWRSAIRMPFLGPTIGRGIGFCRKCSSFGRKCRIVCMTGRFTVGRPAERGSKVNSSRRRCPAVRACNGNANLHC